LWTEDKGLRSLVKGSTGRRISWSLVAALLLPLLVLAMPAKTARAQLTRLPSVGVLDFGVLPSVKASGILGRNATDAVVVEMTRTGRFDVTPRTQLNQQLQDLGLTPPLDNIGIQKLGGALGVDFVATGDVTAINFTENPRRARVTVAIRLTDVVTGELANGAIETGYSPAPAPGFQPDDETLINQAISNAAFNAVKTVNNYTLPTATVIGLRGSNEVILNRGGRDGITTGLDMVVFRGGERVGKVRVTYVASTDSTATVTDSGKGIRPEDRVRAIFNLPGYTVGNDGVISQAPVKDIESYRPNQKKKKSIIGTVVGVAAAVLLATLLFKKRSNTQSAGLSSLRARAFALAGTSPGDPSAARVEITWEAASDIPQQNIIEYQVYRDGRDIIAVLPPGQSYYVDGPNLPNEQVTYSRIVYAGGGNTNDGTTTTGGTTNTGGNNNNTGGNNGGNTNGTSEADPTQIQSFTVNRAEFVPGVSHTYSVQILYRAVRVPDQTNGGGGGNIGGGNIGGGGIGGGGGGIGGGGGNLGGGGGGNTNGNNNGIFYRQTSLASSSGVATPIARPQIVTPGIGQEVDPANVRATIRTVQGANQYVLEFATNLQFNNKYQTAPELVSGNGTDVTLPRSGSVNLRQRFPEIDRNSSNGQATTIFVRVGARNAYDNPGPTPNPRGFGGGAPNGNDYVYSSADQPSSFVTTQTPPPPPAQ
jgi:TolB-like protein